MSTSTGKILKFSGLALGGMIIGAIVAVVVVRPEGSAERSIEIDRPADEVFEHVRYLRNQEHYGVWAERDPDMHQEYHGVDGTVDAKTAQPDAAFREF